MAGLQNAAADRVREQLAEVIAPLKIRSNELARQSRLDDAEAECLYAIVHQHILKKDWRAALHLLRALLGTRPTHLKYLKALAFLHRELGNFRQAIDTYRLLDVLDPFRPEYSLSMVQCFLQVKSRQAAEDLLEEVIHFCETTVSHPESLERARAMRHILRSDDDATGQSR